MTRFALWGEGVLEVMEYPAEGGESGEGKYDEGIFRYSGNANVDFVRSIYLV